jgi:hypothetical protein
MINNVQAMFASTFNGTRSGNITDTTDGQGTFATLVSHAAGEMTIDHTVTYANGKTVNRDVTITKNADGTYSETTQTQRSNGKTSTRQETITINADGSETIAGTFTGPNGKTDNLAGTVNGDTESCTLTDPAGKTESWTRQRTVSDGTATTTCTGTNFAGTSFSNTVASTVLSKQKA